MEEGEEEEQEQEGEERGGKCRVVGNLSCSCGLFDAAWSPKLLVLL